MKARRSRWLLALAALVACLRFGTALYKAPPAAHGDFFASLPGAYVKTLNPALWNNPELTGSYGYQREIYVYGPIQYLTLYPMALLGSYSRIATTLGWVYAALIAWSLVLIASLLEKQERFFAALLATATVGLLFPPLQQVYIQREFEVVVFLSIVAATWLLAERRDVWAGALLGAMIWFKLWPVVFLGCSSSSDDSRRPPA